MDAKPSKISLFFNVASFENLLQKNIKSHHERRENVVGAFAVERGSDFDGRTVLLVDDVLTSGGTVAECARALRRAGAANVDAFVLALAVKRSGLELVHN